MRLATVRTAAGTAAVRVDGGTAVEIGGVNEFGELLADPAWRERARAASGREHVLASLSYAPLVPRPDKIICVGLNYRSHMQEMRQEPPRFPTLFAKFRSSLVGAHDDIVLPEVASQVDWEAELAVVVGSSARHVDDDGARAAIAGYSVLNDVSVRDWQHRTVQWLQGKTFEHSTPLGPWLVTSDEFDGRAAEITCEVNGETMQKGDISDLVFGPTALVAYISDVITLLPGDVIATGTPGGVGVARNPQRFLQDGEVVTTRIAGIGELRNECRREARSS